MEPAEKDQVILGVAAPGATRVDVMHFQAARTAIFRHKAVKADTYISFSPDCINIYDT
jgi:hypothetical protein